MSEGMQRGGHWAAEIRNYRPSKGLSPPSGMWQGTRGWNFDTNRENRHTGRALRDSCYWNTVNGVVPERRERRVATRRLAPTLGRETWERDVSHFLPGSSAPSSRALRLRSEWQGF